MPAGKMYRVGRSRTGLGLFATTLIAPGTVIIAYRGRRISHAEAERRDARGNRYVFEINHRWSIDGSSRSNIARYANHSCRPNAEADLVRGKLVLRALKRIKPDDEITFDYGPEYFDLFLAPIGCRCAHCRTSRKRKRNTTTSSH
ncbi:MAG: SET domain-containing protein [Xanthobacteraceae bacterium]